MKKSEQSSAIKPWPRSRKIALSLALTVGFAAFIINQLPGGAYPTDLSRIGTGRPVLVLAQDGNYTGGMAVMEAMNAIRGDYSGKVDFLVAHLGMTEGQAFARQHSARDGTVVLFGNDGQPISVLNQPESADELRRALNLAFGL